MKRRLAMACAAISLWATTGAAPPQAAYLPNPVIDLVKMEVYAAGGRSWVRYSFDVTNKSDYPDALFAPAPTLPPCGLNKNSSRTWVDFFSADGTRLYGFCALGKAQDLGTIWFASERGTPAPASVYIEIMDRQTGIKYRSNLAPTKF